MRQRWFSYCLLMLLILAGCDRAKKEIWGVSLDKEDKRPYGTYLAYQSLKYYFPGANIEALSNGFRYTGIDNRMKYDYRGHNLMILQGLDFYLSENEWDALKEFIRTGNEVMIFASTLDRKIEEEISCYKLLKGEEEPAFYQFTPQNNRYVVSVKSNAGKLYGYDGHSIRGYFQPDADTTFNINDTDNGTYESVLFHPDTLGYAGGNPDFVRYTYGKGHLTLHAAPLVLSNYFLLQPGNEEYLTAIWQTLPQNITGIFWNDYYKRNAEAAGMDILWRYPATRLALYLAIFAILMYLLFEGKRKQRIIPVRAALKNDSVSFVETVGRLYYNKGNHNNLSEKMIQQFLEWVRGHYFLNTNLLNEHFIQQLTMRSGEPEATVRGLLDMIHEIKLGSVKADDAYLYQLYQAIQQFYKNHGK